MAAFFCAHIAYIYIFTIVREWVGAMDLLRSILCGVTLFDAWGFIELVTMVKGREPFLYYAIQL